MEMTSVQRGLDSRRLHRLYPYREHITYSIPRADQSVRSKVTWCSGDLRDRYTTLRETDHNITTLCSIFHKTWTWCVLTGTRLSCEGPENEIILSTEIEYVLLISIIYSLHQSVIVNLNFSAIKWHHYTNLTFVCP